MAYTTVDHPELYFQTVTYTGNEVDDRAVTLPGSEDMQPDFVWIKELLDDPAFVFDSTRGAAKPLFPSRNAAETSDAPTLKSFTTDGFTVGTSAEVNDDGIVNVAWCWNTQGGAGSSNTDGTINSTTTSVGQTQGIAISTYTGTNSAATIGHGLGAVPKMVIGRRINGTAGWYVHHHNLASANYHIIINTTAAQGTGTYQWNDTFPTSTVFSVGSGSDTNGSGDTYVAYCFAPKQGFSKFGTYEGNGNADGTFVHTGFRPAFIMTKSIDSTSNWDMFDNKRDGYNVHNNTLPANLEGTEATTDMIDILSNGFKCRIATDPNVAETYVYMAFAEAPFVNSEGVPCNAR